MAVGLALFVMIGAASIVAGGRLLSDPVWGDGYVERTVSRRFRRGTTDRHRRTLGAGYLVVGLLFVGIGLAVLASDL